MSSKNISRELQLATTEGSSHLKMITWADIWPIGRGKSKSRISLGRCHRCIRLVQRARDLGRGIGQTLERVQELDQGLDLAQEEEVTQGSDLDQELDMTLVS